jgi:CubicO group peptidase (beta-lactamase class C family)
MVAKRTCVVWIAAAVAAGSVARAAPPELPLMIDSPPQLQFVHEVVERRIDRGQLVGAVTWIALDGKVIHHQPHGLANRESGQAMRPDCLFRIHSFTKAISTTAAMILWEQGRFQLDDDVAKYLPEFADTQVSQGEGTGPPRRAMTIRDLMRHTSGIVYPNEQGSATERAYAARNLFSSDRSLAELTTEIARLPLEFSPGEQWKYGMSIDVLGRLVEVWSGQPFEEYLRQQIFAPLGMVDTDFYVPQQKRTRLATLYEQAENGDLQPRDGLDPAARDYVPSSSPRLCMPGGGLFSTAADYGAFLQMIADQGSHAGGRLLQAKTVALMSTDQLPDTIACIGFDVPRDGFGFGLGFNVVTNRSRWDRSARVGEMGWGGAASCHYWIWPPNRLIVITLESTKPYNFNLEWALKSRIYDAVDSLGVERPTD